MWAISLPPLYWCIAYAVGGMLMWILDMVVEAQRVRNGLPTDKEIQQEHETAFMQRQRVELETETDPLQRHCIAENLAIYDARQAKASANVP